MFSWNDHRPADPQALRWDAVVVGAGLGGSFLGWALAKEGLKVLFLERGQAISPFAPRPRTGRLRRLLSSESRREDRVARSYWDQKVTLRRGSVSTDFFMPLGNGPGGSSALYAATLERFLREDFEGCPDGTVEPAPMPGRWPIGYDEFLPYYRKAELMLRVHGGRDRADPDDDAILLPSPPLSARDEDFFRAFEAAGLAPSRMHVGMDYKPGCPECLGELCPRDCKSEGASRALKPALLDYHAKLLLGFEVDRLVTKGGRVDHLIGQLDGEEIKISGKVFVLAAGALCTPAILLKSTSDRSPRGLGNDHDQVGRGLMFHILQVLAFWPTRALSSAGPSKTLSTRAMNTVDGKKLGGVQSFMPKVAVSQIAEFLLGFLERNAGNRFAILQAKAPVLKLAVTALAMFGARLFRDAALFAVHTEDFAYPGNRVALDPKAPSGISITYNETKDMTERASLMRSYLKQRLRGSRMVFIASGAHLNFGHPVGTCRIGNSPESSVLDVSHRVWGVENLFVADASFMPSSAATNPSLTVAAGALRAADLLIRSWHSQFGEEVARSPKGDAPSGVA